jgi:hypothetical protein
MLVIKVGVKFRTVSVKCANIFDQDCSHVFQYTKIVPPSIPSRQQVFTWKKTSWLRWDPGDKYNRNLYKLGSCSSSSPGKCPSHLSYKQPLSDTFFTLFKYIVYRYGMTSLHCSSMTSLYFMAILHCLSI